MTYETFEFTDIELCNSVLLCVPFRSVTSGQWRPPPLACAVGHTAAYAVNAALVESQWQHRTWTASLHPTIKQAACTTFEVYRMTRPNSLHQLWWRVFNQLYHLVELYSKQLLICR